jgi:hypothetical protein
MCALSGASENKCVCTAVCSDGNSICNHIIISTNTLPPLCEGHQLQSEHLYGVPGGLGTRYFLEVCMFPHQCFSGLTDTSFFIVPAR